MNWELLLLRHAKSAWDSPARSDLERPLARRGRRDAPRMGQWLHERGFCPDIVVSSPATRARETVEPVIRAFGLDPSAVTYDPRIYEADVEALRVVLADIPRGARRVLLVGHNPGLDALLEWLCGAGLPRTPKGKLLTTGALARIGLSTPVADAGPAGARLLELVRPRELAA